MGLDNKTTEDLYQRLASDIIWRLDLKWDKTFDVMYEYLKNNINGLENFKGETVSNRFTSEDNVSSDYWRIYKLIQDGRATNCILVSYNFKGSMKFLPMKVISISKLLEDGINKSQELMSFRMEVPENGDKTKTWSFTKQVINCIGAFQEQYEPLNGRIKTIFCPIDIYEKAFDLAKNYDLSILDSSAYSGDRELASCDDDFVEHPIFRNNFNGCTTITAMGTSKENNYKIEVKYADGTVDNERISANSLYEAYIVYMERHGYYSVADQTGKHNVYCTENKE